MLSLPLRALLPELNLPSAWAGTLISGVSLDSRKVRPGYLFLAVDGLEHKGRDFLPQAFAAGAVIAITESEQLELALDDPQGARIGLPSLKGKLSEIAARFYGLPGQHMNIAGVTGTNGKTTCSQLLAQLYYALGRRSGVLGTLGYGAVAGALIDTGMTTPDAVELQRILREMYDQQVEFVAMEVSSHSLTQGRAAAVPVRTALFTNLTRDHLDYHGTMEAYGAAKLSLFHHLGLMRGVVNLDDPFSAEIVAKAPKNIALFTYGVINADADVHVTKVEYLDTGIQAQLVTPWGRGELRVGLLGEFNLSNLLAVVTAACADGFSLAEVLAAAATFVPVPGRMERIAIDADVQVLVDYAHTPDALRAVLVAARVHCKGALWCVFGCGGDRDAGKRPEMAKVAEQLADRCVVTSDNPRTEAPERIVADIVVGFEQPQNCTQLVDRAAAIAFAVDAAQAGDMIIIAGKGHEDYQIVGVEKRQFSDKLHAQAALQRRMEVAP
ncbi:UDP-N-acetylmuramoyl-L-alanyl-D-glutamate--2,6-diaminopimelate ligase [Simiduia aestuariiviva]|uniref:UDP-N-acetylmuramoyl-L-alanyl-D-glutamate--2,6-diaminopimelate ligase n=1 Tax=Simiduia aestuariiviva TaxID=1510459 RepID=A0A839UUD3_9GAMM|nr:UDP-N-acetylmuramoyl-L-alanyl-D-glutamate--2,6-diaminopimelate ligase [Simiduia aestuariiviva]MBB3169108.1 UDP-N-acetylmuramoyl-L-alanyl-D-glutamate--2,6-diaminopimelate ligase [Simiduia aestuariiviva]